MQVSEFNLDEQSGKVYVEYDNGTGVERDLAHAMTGKLNTTTGAVTLDNASRAVLVKSGVATAVPSRKAAQAEAQKGALTGTGNSDFYTGADGVHSSAPGKEYLIRRIVEVSDAVLTDSGY